MLVLGRLIARDQDQALSKVWVSNSIIHGPASPSLTFNLAILPGTCGAILQLWQRGAYHPSTTLHHAVACHRKGWDGKAALLFAPPQGPSGRVCRMGASTTWGAA